MLPPFLGFVFRNKNNNTAQRALKKAGPQPARFSASLK